MMREFFLSPRYTKCALRVHWEEFLGGGIAILFFYITKLPKNCRYMSTSNVRNAHILISPFVRAKSVKGLQIYTLLKSYKVPLYRLHH